MGFPAFNNDFQDQRQLLYTECIFGAKFTALGFTIARKVSNVIEATKNFEFDFHKQGINKILQTVNIYTVYCKVMIIIWALKTLIQYSCHESREPIPLNYDSRLKILINYYHYYHCVL